MILFKQQMKKQPVCKLMLLFLSLLHLTQEEDPGQLVSVGPLHILMTPDQTAMKVDVDLWDP